jgi:hypothetical protein
MDKGLVSDDLWETMEPPLPPETAKPSEGCFRALLTEVVSGEWGWRELIEELSDRHALHLARLLGGNPFEPRPRIITGFEVGWVVKNGSIVRPERRVHTPVAAAFPLAVPAVREARRAAGASSCATASHPEQPQEKAQQLRSCCTHRSSCCSGEGTHRR